MREGDEITGIRSEDKGSFSFRGVTLTPSTWPASSADWVSSADPKACPFTPSPPLLPAAITANTLLMKSNHDEMARWPEGKVRSLGREAIFVSWPRQLTLSTPVQSWWADKGNAYTRKLSLLCERAATLPNSTLWKDTTITQVLLSNPWPKTTRWVCRLLLGHLERKWTKRKWSEASRQTHKPILSSQHGKGGQTQSQGRAANEEYRDPTTRTLPSHPPPPCSKSGSDLLQHPSPESTRKHYILAQLFHLPLAQPALASCQVNIPISWKPDETAFGGVDLSSWPRLPGSQWQPPPLPHPWGLKV